MISYSMPVGKKIKFCKAAGLEKRYFRSLENWGAKTNAYFK